MYLIAWRFVGKLPFKEQHKKGIKQKAFFYNFLKAGTYKWSIRYDRCTKNSLKMKKLILLLTCAGMLAFSAKAQHLIKATNAMSHIGEQVSIVDSVYAIKVYNDSTAVVDMGGKNNKAALNVVFDFDSNFKFDASILKSFKKSKIGISGFVVLIDNQPAIVLTDKQNLTFVSKVANQKYLANYSASK
jgi:hypothetical protein